jgi:hypothetical protein
LSGSLPSDTGKGAAKAADLNFQATYIAGTTTPPPTPPSPPTPPVSICATATFSVDTVSYAIKTYQEVISASDIITYTSPF